MTKILTLMFSALDLIMSRYFYITYIAFMLKDERMIDFINPFSPYNFKANDKKILEYFQLAWQCILTENVCKVSNLYFEINK